MIRTVTATRYVTPLRQGGSLPALVEADDESLYVMKFAGAGQGPKALIAELVAGEIGRALGLHVPELVFIRLDLGFGADEPDSEIRGLLAASPGLNLGLRFLPYSFEYNPLLKPPPEPAEASAIVWFDAYVTNVDRSSRNINMLSHRRQLWLIDHGACLYFHHDWRDYLARSRTPFAPIRTHALLRFARGLAEADAALKPELTPDVIDGIVSLIPDVWPKDGVPFSTAEETRQAYREWLLNRLDASQLFVEEAQNARPKSFDYAIVRIVPQVEREEFINAGVILRCRELRFLAARVELDRARLRAFSPDLDLEMVQAELDLIPLVCTGGPAAGPLGELSQAERFRWLTSPRSTTVQVSPVHCGLCDDPQAALDDLFQKMVK